MSKYVCEVNGYGNGEVVAPRFNQDGSIRDAMIVWLDENAHQHSEVNNSFIPLPVNWHDWTVANAPTGAHLYVNGDKFTNPAITSEELAEAERYRQSLIKQRQSEPDVEQAADAAPSSTESNSPDDAPEAPDLPEPPDEKDFDPRDTDKDGVVSTKEKKDAKKHSKG